MNKVRRRLRIRNGIRKKVNGTSEIPRLSVFRSNKAIYAQVIDDINGRTLVAMDSRKAGIKGNVTVDGSKKVGIQIAEAAKVAGISKIVFDRGGFKYHGQVKALAEGAREGGLKF